MVDSIYFSPHLDDVALSCGGQIHQQTRSGNDREVLIVTLMAGVPRPGPLSAFARQQHAVWGFNPDIPPVEVVQSVVTTRRAEDEAASRILGASWQHWPVPDCIYRRHPMSGEPFYTSDEELFGPVHPAEQDLVAQLVNRLATLPPAKRVVAPLGIGNHVDHQLTRRAAEAYFGPDLWYYEDYPYAQWEPAEVERMTTAGRWQAKRIPLDDAAVAARLSSVAAYASQLEMLFSGRDAMHTALTQFIQEKGGEWLWRQH